jgi:DNA-binding FrmR family transcriptional regulator
VPKDTEVENIGNRVADMLDQIYELARADRELLTKYLDSHIAHNEDKARLSEMAAEIIELLGRLPDAEV